MDAELPEELEAAIAAVAWKVPQGLTIGPEAIPKEATPIALIQRLEGMLHAATSEGWIDAQSVSREGKPLLEEARVALTHADTRQASKSLTNFLDMLGRRQATELLPEGYSLLKLNLEYVLSQIKQQGVSRP